MDWNEQRHSLGTLFRTSGAEGDWTISSRASEKKSVRLSYGQRTQRRLDSGKTIAVAWPQEVGRFSSVHEAMIAVETWEHPGEQVRPASEIKAELGFAAYIGGLERRNFNRSTSLYFSSKPTHLSLSLESSNSDNIGVMYAVLEDGGSACYPGNPDSERIQDISATILGEILKIRLARPYDHAKGIRQPVNAAEFSEWMDAREAVPAPSM